MALLLQPLNFPVPEIDVFGARLSGKAGHAQDVPGQDDEKAGARVDFDPAHRHLEIRPPEKLRIVRERVLRLGDADRKLRIAELLGFRDVPLRTLVKTTSLAP